MDKEIIKSFKIIALEAGNNLICPFFFVSLLVSLTQHGKVAPIGKGARRI